MNGSRVTGRGSLFGTNLRPRSLTGVFFAAAMVALLALGAAVFVRPAAAADAPAEAARGVASYNAARSAQTTGPIIAMTGGDIACGPLGGSGCQQGATAALLTANSPDLVLPLGDNQYECGSLSDFQNYYGPSWGQVKPNTHPSAGNHEYQVDGTAGQPCYGAPSGAPGYFTYFGNAASPNQPGCTSGCQGYYSYDAGSWHIIVLNSVCNQVGGCGLGSPEETWLRNDLAAHPNVCTLAYWHYPRYTSGLSQSTFVNSLSAFWQDLYNGGADIILNGHDHDYERFAPMDANGNLDATHGIREFIVGTGGKSHQPFGSVIAANSQVRDSTTYGVLKLTLGSGSYSWQFIPVAGQTFTDSGSTNCH